MSAPPIAPAATRNTAPLLGVLRHELSTARSIFEIGSGTGQHAVAFAAMRPDATWQTSDLGEQCEGIRRQIEASGLHNLPAPIELDIRTAGPVEARYDAIFTCNTAHIMSIEAVACMFEYAAAALNRGGRLLCYGPFRRGGAFNTPSNAAFDRSLRRQDSDMGIRDLERLDRLGDAGGLMQARIYAMPSNNLAVVWQRNR